MPGTEPKAVIIGSGRSGSGYIAQVLSAAGIPCGHENWWNPHGDRAEGLLVDSSWCAVGHLDGYQGAVFHQVRHPLSAISSLAAHPDWGPYAEWRGYPTIEDQAELAMLTYVDWNQRCELLASQSWKVEGLGSSAIWAVADAVGVGVSAEDVFAALASVPRNVNDHGTATRFTWATLPDNRYKPAVMAMAERYGYE